MLLWTAETISRPTFCNLSESYEGWAYRSGLSRELARLEKQKLLERAPGMARICRLTNEGRLHVLGGRDPEARWSRGWDGRWRLVCFDIPTTENKHRLRLRRYLRERGFGYLQNSVWITPDRLHEELELLRSIKPSVESLVLFEGRTVAGESNMDLVTGAWDFEKINRLYRQHLEILDRCPASHAARHMPDERLRSWAKSERVSWNTATVTDPFLPQELSPPGYLGHKVWRRRVKVLRRLRPELERRAFR